MSVTICGLTWAGDTTVTFGVTTPSGLDHNNIPIGATDSLDIRDNVKVERLAGTTVIAAMAVNVGLGETAVGSNAKTGTVYGNGTVFLRAPAITGDVFVGGTFTKQQGTAISGRTTTGRFDTARTTWDVTFPQSTASFPTASTTLLPGAYGAAAIANAQTITLKPGTYTFASFRMECPASVET